MAGRLVVAMATNVSRTDQKVMAWKSCTSYYAGLGQQLPFDVSSLLSKGPPMRWTKGLKGGGGKGKGLIDLQ